MAQAGGSVAAARPKLVAAVVGRLGERGEVGLPLRIVNARGPRGEGVADGVEADPVADAGVQDAGDLPGIVE